MEPTGFGLGVIAEARTLATSIKNRIQNYRKGPATFLSLNESVDRLARHIEEVEKLLQTFPDVVPADISVIFNETFSAVRDNLKDANRTMESSFSTPFSKGNSSLMGKLRSRAVRTFRANALNNKMGYVETQVKEASNQLLQLSLSLGTALKIEGKFNADKDQYRPVSNTPALTDTVKLDFDTKDEEGKPTTLEGILKQAVLCNKSSSVVTAAAGVMKSGFGIVGMAGVGKTVALKGLGWDKDVCRRFSDGIHFMTLGQGASLEIVLREIANLLARTGATTLVGAVKESTSLCEAVDMAVPWFEGKICLFLFDDIWLTKTCKTGFLTDLRQLVRQSPQSRIAISTRNVEIAQCAGSIVKFGARDAFGTVSQNIFFAHATGGAHRGPSATQEGKLRNSIRRILGICCGLPIALALTGSAVAFLTNLHGNFERACDAYATRLEKKKVSLGDEKTMEGMNLNASILLSLEFLEAELLKWKAKGCHDIVHSITDLYTSLCVVENQSWIPVSVLGRVWGIDEDGAAEIANMFCGMSLCTINLRRTSSGCSEKAGIVLHDLQLEFCRNQAMETKKSSFWHDQVLNGYLPTSHESICERPNVQLSDAILSFTPRPWWSKSVPEDGYIQMNVCRHLSCAGHDLELGALMLDARWTVLRGRVGGILGLKTDFELFEKCFTELKGREDGEAVRYIIRSFEKIFKAVRVSWGRHGKGLRAFQFQVCGRLVNIRKSNNIVETYLKSMEANTRKPYLVGMSPLFSDVDGAQIMEIPIGGDCKCVAFSPCGRYVAAAAGHDVVVVNSNTGEILKAMGFYFVTSIAFLSGSKKIVCGSHEKVIVWTWESSDSPVQVFEERDNRVVRSIAEGAYGQFIISTLPDLTVRAWDTIAGTQAWELVQSSFVDCLAICAEDGKIALCLGDGTLKVLDWVTKETLFEDAEAHKHGVSCVSFSPNGSYLATVSRDKKIRLWNTQSWTIEWFGKHDDLVTSVAFSPDGNQIASSSEDGTIRLWDVASGKCVGASPRIGFVMQSVSFTADGERIVSGSDDGIVRIWDAHLGIESEEQRYGHNGQVLGISISEDGLRIASASEDGTVRLWDSVTGDQVGVALEGHGGGVRCVSFSPDGRRLVSGSHDRTLRLWDTDTYMQIGSPFEGHTRSVQCASFSRDGRRIISGAGDVRVWNAETHEQIGDKLQGQGHGRFDYVNTVAESADGCHIVGGNYGKTMIWNSESRAMIWTSEDAESRVENDDMKDESNSGDDIANVSRTVGNEISNDEAEKIIRSCGRHTPHLWPRCFPEYTVELFCDVDDMFTNVLGEKTLLGDIPSMRSWYFHKERKILAIGLISGDIARCKLITE